MNTNTVTAPSSKKSSVKPVPEGMHTVTPVLVVKDCGKAIELWKRAFGAEELTLCDLALREGLVLDYTRRNRRQIAQIDNIPDVRRRSTL